MIKRCAHSSPWKDDYLSVEERLSLVIGQNITSVVDIDTLVKMQGCSPYFCVSRLHTVDAWPEEPPWL